MKLKKQQHLKEERKNTCHYNPETGTVTRISVGRKEVELLNEFVYLIQSGDSNLFKLGRAKNFNQRLSELQTGNPFPLRIVQTWETVNAPLLESTFQKILKVHSIGGEWFELPSLELIEKCHQVFWSPEGKKLFHPDSLTESDDENLHDFYEMDEEEKYYWDNLSYEELE